MLFRSSKRSRTSLASRRCVFVKEKGPLMGGPSMLLKEKLTMNRISDLVDENQEDESRKLKCNSGGNRRAN